MRIKFYLCLVLTCLCLFTANNVKAQPDLTVLDDYPNPFGDTCDIEGNPNATPDKKARNRLKNRFSLPTDVEELTLDEIVAIVPAANQSVPRVDHPNQKRAVSVIGYVRGVSPGGSRGESCNCKARGANQIDTHIDVILYPNQEENDPDGTGILVVEVTERSRRLAAGGHLTANNIGNDWSRRVLKDRLRGRWVKFTGWLFYDDDHHTGSWRFDPDNNEGETNWRATGWELHPVIGIEVLPGRPSGIARNRPNNRPNFARPSRPRGGRSR